MGNLNFKCSASSVALIAMLVCALTLSSSQALAGQTSTAKKRSAAAKKLHHQRSLLKRQLQKNPRLFGSKRFMKAAVRFKLALPGELRVPACTGQWGKSGPWIGETGSELWPTGKCLLVSLDLGTLLGPGLAPLAAWGHVPMTVTFLGGRPYEIALAIGSTPLTTDNSLRTIALRNSWITENPVGAPNDDPGLSNGCSDITTAPGFLANDAYAIGGAAAYPPPVNDAVFSMAYRSSILNGFAKINPFRRSIEGRLDLRMQNVAVFREQDNARPFHCLNIATGSSSSDFSLSIAEEPGLTHDFVPTADGSIRLARIELDHQSNARPGIPLCLMPVAPADVNLSVLGLGDFSGIPEIAWSTPCNAPVPSMGGANPLYGNVSQLTDAGSRVELRPDMSIKSMTAELVLLPGGYVPKTG